MCFIYVPSWIFLHSIHKIDLLLALQFIYREGLEIVIKIIIIYLIPVYSIRCYIYLLCFDFHEEGVLCEQTNE